MLQNNKTSQQGGHFLFSLQDRTFDKTLQAFGLMKHAATFRVAKTRLIIAA